MCDDEGNIDDAVAGPNIVADKDYDYELTIEGWDIFEDIFNYKVVDGELVHK